MRILDHICNMYILETNNNLAKVTSTRHASGLALDGKEIQTNEKATGLPVSQEQ